MGKYFIKHSVGVEIEGYLQSPGMVDGQEQNSDWQVSGEARHAGPEMQWGAGTKGSVTRVYSIL